MLNVQNQSLFESVRINNCLEGCYIVLEAGCLSIKLIVISREQLNGQDSSVWNFCKDCTIKKLESS